MEFLYDRDMPDFIKNMTKEQLDEEIAVLEKLPKITKTVLKKQKDSFCESLQTIG